MNEHVEKFKAEMEKRGLIRSIQVCVNKIPPPILNQKGLIELRKDCARLCIIDYAKRNKDFAEIMVNSALDFLTDAVLTDDLLTDDPNFSLTEEEQMRLDRARGMTDMLIRIFETFGR